MAPATPGTGRRELGLLALLMVLTIALGWNINRDLQRSTAEVARLSGRLSDGLDAMSDLEFHTQEVRRILLYALHTADANLQLEYVEQSRRTDGQVRSLIADRLARRTEAGRGDSTAPSGRQTALGDVDRAWGDYLTVRDDVIGLILEGDVSDAVALDQDRGTARFNEVRHAVARLKATFKAEAEQDVLDARARGLRAARRLNVLVVSALVAAGLGLFLSRRRAALERLEDQLRRDKEHAERATAAKSEFLATVSHELRTPLMGVIGAAELLGPEDVVPARRELVRSMRTSAHLLMDIVGNVLDHSRIDAGLLDLVPVRFAVRALVDDALAPVREAAARKRLVVDCEIGDDVPRFLLADQVRIRQVLLNLLSNAVKFTDAGAVAVGVHLREREGERVAISVTVQDSGRGIPEPLQHRLFQRFSQLGDRTAQGGGSGLGLAISERLSRLLGGSLTVASEEGRGSTFTLTFAATVAGDDPIEDARADQVRPIDTSRKLSILLVEDHHGNRRVIRLMLQELGFDADESVCGADAVARASAHAYDVILMDLQMPDMDGLEATRRIRAEQHSPPPFIIALTASAAQGDEARCRAAGMNAYLAKPLDLDSLAAALRAASGAQL